MTRTQNNPIFTALVVTLISVAGVVLALVWRLGVRGWEW